MERAVHQQSTEDFCTVFGRWGTDVPCLILVESRIGLANPVRLVLSRMSLEGETGVACALLRTHQYRCSILRMRKLH